jgi:predicted HTH transcriptional regulator
MDLGSDFRVNIYRSRPGFNEVSSVNDQVRPYGAAAFTDDDRALLALLHGHPRFTQEEIASALNWTVGQVKYYQTKLKRRQSIKRVGTSQKGHWEVLVPLHDL